MYNLLIPGHKRGHMRITFTLVSVFLFVCISLPVLGQEGRITSKLEVSATRLAQGEIKFGEVLTTREGFQLQPGRYRIAVALNTLGEAMFIMLPSGQDEVSSSGVSKNALNTKRQLPNELVFRTNVIRNTLVRGIASIEGSFQIEMMNPSEAILSFTSKQFASSTILGRSLNSKVTDMMPAQLTIEESVNCGEGCVEGYVKVTVKNAGNTVAKGKWNVMLLDPRFYVGTVSDLAPDEEKTIVSSSKVRLTSGTVSLDAEVHPDFYNKVGTDSNDSNNTRRFTLKMK
jgi:hypothetical protein